ncbi:MAG: stage V sporulation protein AD [Clostridia bacterium]|nr:stage V sporulation protein AD [Clostridia bacterium]
MRKEWIDLDAAFLSSASVVGAKESEGPLGALFDLRDPSDRFGMKSWERAESEMQRLSFNTVLAKVKRAEGEVDALFAGDLLNQCVGSAYGLLDFDIPYFGLYGACSTCAEGLLLAAAMVSSQMMGLCGAVTSSHYCAAERQFRTPLEYGAQRAPVAQWTVTGAGAFLICSPSEFDEGEAYTAIKRGMVGKVMDCGITDAANMGAAMAPAAADTLTRYFQATETLPRDYDLIVTGDLGYEGGDILCDLMLAAGYDVRKNYSDCGQRIYHRKKQDVHGGGSGCGCSAVVLAAELLPKLCCGEIGRMLFLGTGALMSPDSIKQGAGIPGIAHLLELRHVSAKEGERKKWM